MICKAMAKQGYPSAILEKILQQASPELTIRKLGHDLDYCQRTIRAVFNSPEVKLHLEKQVTMERDSGLSL